MLKLQQMDKAGVVVSETEHATLTAALSEHKGWQTATQSTTYRVTGTMSVECACKRILESRNRAITVALMRAGAEHAFGVLLKAPQAVHMLEMLQAPGTDVEVHITSTEFDVL